MYTDRMTSDYDKTSFLGVPEEHIAPDGWFVAAVTSSLPFDDPEQPLPSDDDDDDPRTFSTSRAFGSPAMGCVARASRHFAERGFCSGALSCIGQHGFHGWCTSAP